MNDLTLVIGNKNYSSWSLRAWLYLTLNDIPFTEIRLPLDTPEFQQKIGDYSPTRCVPVLRQGDITVWDSLAIIEYINGHYPVTVTWPEKPAQHALALSAVMEMHSGFLALRNHYPMNCRKPSFKAPMRGDVEKDLARLDQLWQQCLANKEPGPGLLGNLSIVDVYYAPVVFRVYTYQLPLSEICRDYVKRMLALPAMQAWAEAGAVESEVVDADEWQD